MLAQMADTESFKWRISSRSKMKKLIATDLDGTLLYPFSPFRFVPKRNVKFLREYIDQGGRVALVSARGEFFVNRVIKQIGRPIDSLVNNSAAIIHNGEYLRKDTISNELANRIVKYFYENHMLRGRTMYLTTDKYGLIINTSKTGLMTWVGTLIWALKFGWNAEKIKSSKKMYEKTLESGIINKIVIYNGTKKSKRLKGEAICQDIIDKFPEITASWSNYITEITPVGCNKAEGLKFYARKLGILPEDMIVIGDSGNDLPMFEAFPNSFCMSHAVSSVKASAKHEIKQVCDLANFKD